MTESASCIELTRNGKPVPLLLQGNVGSKENTYSNTAEQVSSATQACEEFLFPSHVPDPFPRSPTLHFYSLKLAISLELEI